ncbi:RHS repeat-associated core domain-containing protein [Gilliamella sp. B2911]|uniref:RHS repeat-associated core domain-containing protein n=1 Tax=Gilliamella sp. B2911 TaxID=2817980 RepID=UPI003A5CD449|nr:hypothetical protein [Gilliamella sp. B2911]
MLVKKCKCFPIKNYTHFRYYNSETGAYISKDPISLQGNNPNFYVYLHDSHVWLKPLGLKELIYFCS